MRAALLAAACEAFGVLIVAGFGIALLCGWFA